VTTSKACAGALAAMLLSGQAALALDNNLPPYQPTSGLAGQIKSVGSDTLGNEMMRWGKGFMALYPDVRVEVEAKGSATAPPALLAGVSQFAPMSRTISNDESTAFVEKYSYKASHFRVAVDALAVYVNKDNPIACLSVQQVNRIFSVNRRVGFGGNISRWGQLGLTGDWANRPISLYGRNSLSGTYAFFKEMALFDGDYKEEVQQQPGSETVVQHVAEDKFAMGYSGIGYKSAAVRAVPLSLSEGRTCYDTSAETVYSGDYPFARYLYVYLNKKPGQALDPLRAEFIKYVVSKDGQTQTELGGFYSITADDRQDDLQRLGLTTGP
jgi:phosphate transport system substrate-binding protein